MTSTQLSGRAQMRQRVRRFRRDARQVYAPLTQGWHETTEAAGRATRLLRGGMGTTSPLVRAAVYAIPLIILLVLPLLPFVSAFYRTVLVDRVGFYVLLALGLNVVVGFAGLLDLGYVAFYAIGAYTAAIFTGAGPVQPPFVLDPFLTIPLAVLFAMTAGVVLGLPTLRLRGDYLAIVTLGFHEIVRLTLKNSDPLTNGDRGIRAIPHPELPVAEGLNYTVALIVLGVILAAWGAWKLYSQRTSHGRHRGFGYIVAGAVVALISPVIGPPLAGFAQRFVDFGLDPIPYYYLVLAVIVLMVFIVRRLENSRIGRAWVAIREDEIAAEAMGVPTLKMKVWAFAIGASTAGFAGVMLATKTSFINPQFFILLQSIIVLAMVVFGGMGSITGAIAGAIFIGFTTEALRDFDVVPFGPIFAGVGVLLVIMGLLIGFKVIRMRAGPPYGWWLVGIGAFLALASPLLRIPFLRIAENPENWRLFILGLILTGVMIVRPEGLIPSRRRAAELHGEATAAGEALATATTAEAEENEQVTGKVEQ